ncbi:MAG TPA: alcohol dehydrogenase catalytic domain-containing protein [Thermoanaerobaculia bacterium]|jgi:L-iditol 2-dehydrogenase|nr:alcohol dehydrogenase catalytic domain-containing protein [Thermoanaerobaculia bacterium]
MKAVQVQPDGSVSVVEMEVPKIGPGDALLRATAAGICGSDLLDWYVRRKAGTVVGHEIAGEIVEVGENVTGFAAGDRVIPHHHVPCLVCALCRSGRYVHCPEWRSSRLDPGGMAEYVRIPADNLSRDTLKVPAHLSDEEAAWTEPLATVVKAMSRARLAAGQSILVIGLGSAGQLAVRLAKARGATRIAGADRVRSRLDAAKRGGADELVDVGRQEPRGSFDVVFVCPGKSDVIQQAAARVAPGGTLLLFTMAPPDEMLAISSYQIYFQEISLVPSYSSGPTESREALELIDSGKVRVAELVTHRFPIARAAEAFARARDPEGSVKVMVTFEADS